MTPDVSVIIPAYNTGDYIARSIDSALKQTLHNIEVIVVDDASVDNTVEVINTFSDPRLVKIFSSQNLGAGGARNTALRAATGQWIAVLDSDDWFAPERLEQLVNIAIEKNADIVADDLHLIQDGQDKAWSTLIKESGNDIQDVLLIDPVTFVKSGVYGQQGLHLGLSKPLFKRSFFTQYQIKYDESVKVSQDFWLNIDCLKHGAQFYLVPEPYYYYRSRPGSLVSNNRVRHLSDDKRKILEFVRHPNSDHNSELSDALLDNLKIIKQNLVYYQVVEPLKNKRYMAALQAIPLNPQFFLHLVKRFPGIFTRRLQYYLFRDRLAFEMMYRSKDS